MGVLLLCLLLLGVVALWWWQDTFIYHPRRLVPGPLPPGLERIVFHTDQGRQVAYLQPPQAQHRLWVLFGGNATVALDWQPYLGALPRGDGALLLEYPGYGECEGWPTPARILASFHAALAATSARLGLPPGTLDQDVNLIGYSLGSGAAAVVADDCPHCRRLVLIAPFTRLADMARRQMGWPLCLLLRYDYDSIGHLRHLAARAAPPQVVITHGDADELVPPAMGRTLAAVVPGTRFLSQPGITHSEACMGLASALAVFTDR